MRPGRRGRRNSLSLVVMGLVVVGLVRAPSEHGSRGRGPVPHVILVVRLRGQLQPLSLLPIFFVVDVVGPARGRGSPPDRPRGGGGRPRLTR